MPCAFPYHGRVPELPDLTAYLESLAARVRGRKLVRVKLLNPFLLRTAVPPLSSAEGREVVALRRVGKRIVLELEGRLFLVLHLMVAGRLRWLEGAAKPPGRITLALLEFDGGTLAFTEAGTWCWWVWGFWPSVENYIVDASILEAAFGLFHNR